MASGSGVRRRSRRDRDHHLLVGDPVLDVDLVAERGDLGAALVAEALGDRRELLRSTASTRDSSPRIAHPPAILSVTSASLLLIPVRLERGQLREAQVEDRRRLDEAQLEADDQLLAAASRSREPRISSMIASRWSSAVSSPSRMWARASFSESSCFVRLTITSRWCAT